MARKANKNTKAKIVNAAWKLFYEQGYENTSVEEIVYESGTSRGSFYHYFEGKDDLLNSLSDLFDSKYEELQNCLPDNMSSFDKLMFLNLELFKMMENETPFELVSRLYSSQLTTKGSKSLLDHNRVYYKLLRKIIADGQNSGEFRNDISLNEIVKAYALCERAIISDWCLCNGEYSLSKYSESLFPVLFKGFLK
ncbi:MAG: TetR/AcrR family transcriptional regulator [Clostridia bacterium]|nr:TetR/AcrR family transcriptional regulator [Clostridia bacterium]